MNPASHPIFNTENPPAEVQVEGKWMSRFVHEEDFNQAVRQICEDTEFIQSKLSSLEDNDPHRESLEDAMSGRLTSGWPEGVEAPTSFRGLMDKASEMYNQNRESIDGLEVNFGVAGLGGIAGIGLGIAGIIAPAMIVAIPVAAAGATLVASSQMGNISELNNQIEQMSQVASCIHGVREDFEQEWHKLFDEDKEL